jgi:gamma-glutamyltranspeptidase/glutathione hydrolase
VSIIDRWGNVVSATQTLGSFYGSKKIHPELGIVYNNLMEGLCGPEPRKIFNNEMAPTIVVRDGQPLLALGSPASSRIFAIVANVISYVVDRELELGAAIEAPRALWTGGDQPRPTVEVIPPVTIKWVKELMNRGFTEPTIARIPGRQGTFTGFGGVNAVYYDAATGIATGAGDPRRDGSAAGARF